MSLLESLARQAFDTARVSLARLREPQEDGAIPLHRFAEVEKLRFASGRGVLDTKPKGRVSTWTEFCGGVEAYAETVIGPSEEDKVQHSKYVIAGEVARAAAAGTDGLSAGPAIDSYRTDVEVRSQTMLILDCDAPVSEAPLCRALDDLHLAYCVAPTWASAAESPRWRCFLPIAPLLVDLSEVGRVQARMRYAWLAGLLSGLSGLPEACPVCEGSGSETPHDRPAVCKCCLGGGKFRFDLSCWNYSRLHFVGGRQTTDVPMVTRRVRWAKGYGIDTQAWLSGSGFAEFWDRCAGELETERAQSTLPADVGEGAEGLHPDPSIASAMAGCAATLVERVRRACLYIGSPEFPASSKVAHDPRYGHDDLMRAASAVVSGFLVPLEHEGEEWALRVLETAYNPRCCDLDGVPYPWSSAALRKKLRDVRAGQGGGAPGSLLQRRSDEGATFYVVLFDGSQGMRPEDAGVYSERGEQRPGATWSGALLELSVAAARACPVRAFDPEALPSGFRPRKLLLESQTTRRVATQGLG